MSANQHEEESEGPAARHRLSAWVLAGAVALASVGISLGLLAATGAVVPDSSRVSGQTGPSVPTGPPAQNNAPSLTPDSAQAPSVTGPPGGTPPGLERAVAQQVLAQLLVRAAEVAGDPGQGVGRLGGLARGEILEELRNDQLELEHNGWTRSGKESIVSLEVTANYPSASPPTATVQACIDSKDVVLLDSAGKPIVSGMTPQQKRSINIYTMVLDGAVWQVSDRTFPDNAAC